MSSPFVCDKKCVLIVKESCPVGEEFQTHSRAVSGFGRVQSRRVRGRASEETPQSFWHAAKPLQSHMVLSVDYNTRKLSANTITTEWNGFPLHALSNFFVLVEITCCRQAQLEMSARSVGKGWNEVQKGEDTCRRREVRFCTRARRK